MLLWQPKKLPRKAQFFFRVFLFTAGLHVLFLFWMLFMYRGGTNQITVSKHLTSGAPIVFMPLYKKVNQKSLAPQTLLATAKRSVVKKVVPKKTKQQALKKTEKPSHTTTLAVDKNKVKQKKEPLVAAIQENKKNEQEVKPVIEPVKESEKLASVVNEPSAEDQVLHVGRQELEALQMQEFLNELIGTHWEPPVGLSPELVCTIKVVVDWQGAITDVVVAQSSGVLIYDFSARNALQRVAAQVVQQQVNLPQWTKGKEFTITFKQ